MSELSLDHDQRDPLSRHLDSVHVAQLMRSEAAAHASERRGVM
jgi:hypothetical protein